MNTEALQAEIATLEATLDAKRAELRRELLKEYGS